jgi:hypothetical protein
MSQDEIAERVGVKPFQLQKIMEKLRGKQKGYFEGASSYLYEWEMLLKGSSLSPKLLLDLLHIRLASLRK